jgi:hypothetical protein
MLADAGPQRGSVFLPGRGPSPEGAGAASEASVTFHIHGVTDPHAVARVVDARLDQRRREAADTLPRARARR